MGRKRREAKGAFSSTQVKYKVSAGSDYTLCLLKRAGRVTTRRIVLDRWEAYARANAEFSAEIQSPHAFPNSRYIFSSIQHNADASGSETTELKEEVLSSTCLIAPVLYSGFISSQ